MAKSKNTPNRERLQALIQEATVDCYDEEEQQTGFMTMLEDNVICPFQARVVGEPVQVTGFEPAERGRGLFATCTRGGKTYRVDLRSVEWIEPHPEGFEWVEAYLAWSEWQ